MINDQELLNEAKAKYEEAINFLNKGFLIDAANKFIECSNELSRIPNDNKEAKELEIKSLINQAAIMINLNRYALSVNALLKAYQLLKSFYNRDLLEATYINLISAFIGANRLKEAENFIEKLEKIDTNTAKAYSLLYKSKIALLKGVDLDILSILEESKSIFARLNMYQQVAAAIILEAEFYQRKGDFDKANQKIEEAKRIVGNDASVFLRSTKVSCK